VGDVIAQMPPAEGGSARHRELLLDGAARDHAGVGRRHERLARLQDERLDLVRADADHLRHLGVRELAQLGQEQRGALVVGQRAQVGEQVAQLLAPLDVGGEVLRRRNPVVGQPRIGAPCADDRDAPVARDGVEPGAHRARDPSLPERRVGGEERVLDDVLAVLRLPEHVPREREQREMVADVELLERLHVAAARRARELPVRAGTRAQEQPSGRRCRGRHVGLVPRGTVL
jgi:hypothetical protein